MRGDQLARQWQLIQLLARSRGGVGLDQLAEELGCVRRTVYRDLDALMYAGFPVVSEKRDGRVFYRFVESFRLGDVPFTPDELLALAFGEDLLRTLEGTLFHDSIRSAIDKIRRSLGPEIGRSLAEMGDAVRALPGPRKHYGESDVALRTLHAALLERRRVEILYRSGRSGEEKERRFDPYRVWYRDGALYAIGHDNLSGELRTFAVDRIRRIQALDETFEVPESFDFDAYAESAFGVVSQDPVSVRIRFDRHWRAFVEERVWHPTQALSPREDGGLDLVLEVGPSEELRGWILSFGPGAEVLEPPSLRRAVAADLARSLEAYAEDGSGGA